MLRPGGRGIFMVYNRVSWLNALSKLMKVQLEHEDAPVLRKFSIAEFRRLLTPFATADIVPERFPVKSRLHKGWKGVAFNTMFVGTFNALPHGLVRPLGWHLMAFCAEIGAKAVVTAEVGRAGVVNEYARASCAHRRDGVGRVRGVGS